MWRETWVLSVLAIGAVLLYTGRGRTTSALGGLLRNTRAGSSRDAQQAGATVGATPEDEGFPALTSALYGVVQTLAGLLALYLIISYLRRHP